MFLTFPRKNDLTFHADCLLVIFSAKIRKFYFPRKYDLTFCVTYLHVIVFGKNNIKLSSAGFACTCSLPNVNLVLLPASVAQLDAPSDWRPGGRGFNPRQGRQHSFVEIDCEIFSTVILSLPLIQEGQLSVSGERMCTILVNPLED